MRLEKIRLVHFKIFTALNKPVIELDFSSFTNPITLIIGKMGSGKTALLGQLHPMGGYGNLDIRGHESPIVEGENGEKSGIIIDGDSIYEFKHLWTWNKSTLSHSRKSYLTKDGVELNENGNVSSFDSILYYELGIDQTYLKLIRIGSNVINIPNLKDADRKSSFVTFIPSADFYVSLSKALSQELRMTNANVTLLANKLSSLNNKSGVELDTQLKDISDKVKEDELAYQKLMKVRYRYEAEMNVLLKGMTIAEFNTRIEEMKKQKKSILQKIEDEKSDLEKVESFYGSPIELQQKIGELKEREKILRSKIEMLSKKHQELENKANALLYTIQANGNAEHVKEIKSIYEKLLSQISKYKSELGNFSCKYDLDTIYALTEKIVTFKNLINDLKAYNQEDVVTIFNSGNNILSFASRKIELIRREMSQIETEVHNIDFSKGYQAPCILHTPPGCPTLSCLYYRTHPDTIRRSEKEKVSQVYLDAKTELGKLDVLLARYNDYPTIYSLIQSSKLLWKQIYPLLQDIGSLNESSLLKILTTLIGRLDWYDTTIITQTIEKLEKRNKYRELLTNANNLKEELDLYAINDVEKYEKEYQNLQTEIESIMNEIESSDQELQNTIHEQLKYDQFYVILTKGEMVKLEIEKMEKETEDIEKSIDECITDKEKILDYVNRLNEVKVSLSQYDGLLRDDKKQLERLKTLMSNIITTKAEYEEASKEQFRQKLIYKAISTSKGIPIYLMSDLADMCKDYMNELLQDAMGDQIEIQDFDIKEDRFLIPYTVNGTMVNDISKASQGQTSFINLALAFSLIELAPHKYNIPLLDEVDSSLYESDRNHIISIILKVMKAIDAEQLFFISHNNTWDGYPVNVIMTTDENIEGNELMNIIRI